MTAGNVHCESAAFQSPGWIDVESAYRAASAMADGNESNMTWGECLAHAQAAMEHYSDVVAHGAGTDVMDGNPVRMAAMILGCAASVNGLDDAESRRNAGLLAVCAHGMYGENDMAGAVVEGHCLLDMDLSPAELVAVTASCPGLWKYTHMRFGSRSSMQTCVAYLRDHMMDGDARWLEHAIYAVDEALAVELDAWDICLLRFSRVCLEIYGNN